MREELQPGLKHEFRYRVPDNKTVPHLFPEATDFQHMPQVLATGYLVGLLEWACIDALRPYLDWPQEQTLGISIQTTHEAATPPGMEVTVQVELQAVEGRKLRFALTAHDGIDRIAVATHERAVVKAERFNAALAEKVKSGA